MRYVLLAAAAFLAYAGLYAYDGGDEARTVLAWPNVVAGTAVLYGALFLAWLALARADDEDPLDDPYPPRRRSTDPQPDDDPDGDPDGDRRIRPVP